MLSQGPGKLAKGGGRRWRLKGKRGERQERLTLNSSGLRGPPTWWPAERSAIRGSYPLRGPGAAVALVRSEGRGLFHGEHVSLFPLFTPILVVLLSFSCPWERTTVALLLAQEKSS